MPVTAKSRAALRWSSSLVEPLLSTAQRSRFDNDWREVARADAPWFCSFCAGVLAGIASSLPQEDPWRTVKVDANGVAKWPDGLTFGRPADHFDVLHPIPELDEPGVDPTSIALEQTISSESAALVAMSFNGWREPYAALVGVSFDGWSDTYAADEEAQVHYGPDMAFDVATSAIRWALHRRRSYSPEAWDAHLDFLVLKWAALADDVVANGSLSNAAQQELDDRARIERDVLAKIAKDLEFFTTTD